jgi:Co/Zn/Cd efflux system component
VQNLNDTAFVASHDHVFLGSGHEKNERKTWSVIALCSVMMLIEIVGGNLFGSLALVADGLHMSTHAGAMLIAALAYTYARKHAADRRFVFGTGKLGDLAGYTSAVILAMIALLIGYAAIARFLSPVPIHFDEAIPIAIVGLAVNIASAWLLSGADHGHEHGHGHTHTDGHAHRHGATQAEHGEEKQLLVIADVALELSIFEDGVPPVFRIASADGRQLPQASEVQVMTIRPDGSRQTFPFFQRPGYLESIGKIPEPHAFKAQVVLLPGGAKVVEFAEHDHDDHKVAIHIQPKSLARNRPAMAITDTAASAIT